jgi:hypothetical protein
MKSGWEGEGWDAFVGKKKLLTAKVAEKGRRERGEDLPFSWIILCSWSEREG